MDSKLKYHVWWHKFDEPVEVSEIFGDHKHVRTVSGEFRCDHSDVERCWMIGYMKRMPPDAEAMTKMLFQMKNGEVHEVNSLGDEDLTKEHEFLNSLNT